MTRLARLCLILAGLLVSPMTQAQDRPFVNEFAYSERVGKWVIDCTNYARKLNGKILPYNSCILRREQHPDSLKGGNALIITAAYGVEWIYPAIGDRHCDKQPRARLVDNIYITNMSVARQIELLRRGQVYTEEFMPRKWPECWIVVRKAPLDGFEAAYVRFREVARERGALW